jgi:endonuclease YncB( thermonuclease family)
MRILKFFFLIFLASILTQTAFSQLKYGGRAVEVVDGKTLIIETPSRNRITIVLQFIEIPEPEQPLYQIVKEHLGKTVLDKTVEFVPRELTRTKAIGQVFLGKIDLSQQLLRDGAAWYALPEKDRQNPVERELYELNEGQAKLEKRGVWSIENLKPAWEFRAEKEEIRRQRERAKIEEQTAPTATAQQTQTVRQTRTQRPTGTGFGLDMWSKVNDSAAANKTAANGGLLMGAVPNYGFNYVMTSGNFLELNNGTAKRRTESRAVFVYPAEQKRGDSGYVIGFLIESEKYTFTDSNSLVITADGQKIQFGKAYRLFRPLPFSVQELLLYQINAVNLTKISDAQEVKLTIGKFSGEIGKDYQDLIKNLLTVTK